MEIFLTFSPYCHDEIQGPGHLGRLKVNNLVNVVHVQTQTR